MKVFSIEPTRPDLLIADVAAVLAALCLLWLGGGILLALAARLPGPLGRVALALAPAAFLALTGSSTAQLATVRSLDHVVVPGDTLWDIAEHTLGAYATPADVDAEWRRWYAANRAVVGPDPDLIRPGQRLRPPAVP